MCKLSIQYAIYFFIIPNCDMRTPSRSYLILEVSDNWWEQGRLGGWEGLSKFINYFLPNSQLPGSYKQENILNKTNNCDLQA